jgi:outer membrane protein, heavy metal efflux system
VAVLAAASPSCEAIDWAGQTPLSWREIVARCEATNPTVQAGRIRIDESRAAEVTAYLRANPLLSVSVDQFPAVGDATSPAQNLLTVASLN